jgi:outer membrane protein assembly factor BamB
MNWRIGTLLAATFLAAAVAGGATITVDSGGLGEAATIQAAVDRAGDGDTVEIKPGTYTGAGNRDIEVRGKAITIRSVDPNDPGVVGATIIGCNDPKGTTHRAFTLIGQKPQTTLAGLTIAGGQGTLDGGGIKCLGFVTVSRCHILNCSATRGGAIFCSGLWEDDSMDCPLEGDGAVVRILDCRIEGNWADRGGGIYASGEHVLVKGCELVSNRATSNGGAIACSVTVADLVNNTIHGNSAREGAGIWLHETAGGICDSCIAENQATGHGAGVCVRNSTDQGTPRFTLRGCTLVGNVSGGQAGGLLLQDADPIECPEGYGRISNSILWGNRDAAGSGQAAQVRGNRMQVIYCCIQDDNPNDLGVPFNDAQGHHNIDDDPLFAGWPKSVSRGRLRSALGAMATDTAGNGDFADLHLRPESPCIQAGEPTALASADAVDMDGQPRKIDGIVDIGADEYSPSLIAILQPRGGQLLLGGTTHVIAWQGRPPEGRLSVELSTDAGNRWQILDSNVLSTDSLSWQVPQVVRSDVCLIRLALASSSTSVLQVAYTGFFSIYPAASDPNIPSRWRTLAGDFQRTGRSRDSGPKLGCIQWRFETPSIIAGGAVIGWNGRIHLATYDGQVCTLDPGGRLLWTCDIHDAILEAPTVGDDGTLYVGTQGDGLHEITPDGQLRRSYHMGPMAGAPAILPDGRLTAAASVLDPRDGRFRSLWPSNYEMSFASPAVGLDGTAYVLDWDKASLWAFESGSLRPKWEAACDPEAGPLAGPVVGGNGLIYQTFLDDSHLYAIDAKTGSIAWTTDLADPCTVTCGRSCLGVESWSEPVLGPDGTIYAGLDDSFVRAVDPNGGRAKWVTQLGSARSFTLTVDRDGCLYAASDDGCLYVVDMQGHQMARFTSDTPLNYPVIASGSLLLVNGVKGMGLDSSTGVLYAIAEDVACATPDLRPPEDRPAPKRR